MTSTLSKFIDEYGFDYAASITADPNLKAGYRVNFVDGKVKDTEGVVYLITVDDDVVKIGGSGQTLPQRWASYQAGTKQAREKGTCSVTNYDVSQYLLKKLDEQSEVALYAYNPEPVTATVNLFNQQTKYIKTQVWKEYEKFLLDEYEKLNLTFPILSKNK